MSDAGIRGLPDPSGLFLSRRPEPVAGTCVTVTLEGRRPLLAEVQALVAASPLAAPRRGTSGLDAARVAMVLAVLERRGRVPLASRDVYTATVGGVRLAEPGVDLAVALAVASAAADRALPPDLVAVGEVGLAGDLRPLGSVSPARWCRPAWRQSRRRGRPLPAGRLAGRQPPDPPCGSAR